MIFIILVSSNVDVTDGYYDIKWRCIGILRPKIAVAATVWTSVVEVFKKPMRSFITLMKQDQTDGT